MPYVPHYDILLDEHINMQPRSCAVISAPVSQQYNSIPLMYCLNPKFEYPMMMPSAAVFKRIPKLSGLQMGSNFTHSDRSSPAFKTVVLLTWECE
uniref:Uncharacterized protein n=1 Tax=Romanomermis culicivorax TaxID=13658 RepID=A0A915II02_ROMCU